MSEKARDYTYQKAYNARPEQVKRREERNAARRLMMRKGLVHKGDGKDIDHKDFNTADNKLSNLRVLSASKNRSRNQP